MGDKMRLTNLNVTIVQGGGGGPKKLAYDNGGTPANGDIRATSNQQLTWSCSTQLTLTVDDFSPVASGNDLPSAYRARNARWPFVEPQNQNTTGPGGGQLTLTVKGGADKGVYKYSLKAVDPGAPDVNDDPQIIID